MHDAPARSSPDRSAGPVATGTPPGAFRGAAATLRGLWLDAGLPAAALDGAELPDPARPVLAASLPAAGALQAAIGAAALAAVEVGARRGGPRQRIGVGADDAAAEAGGHFAIDGTVPPLWDRLAGLYRCADGHVRLHTNFAHHRDAALRVLGLPEGDGTDRAAVEAAVTGWPALKLEDAVMAAGGVAAALREPSDWDAHAQAGALAAEPLVDITPIDTGGAPAPPRRWPALAPGARPLAGLRVLDLTRILAGPVGARTLAAYGADVLMVNGPHLPNIAAIAELSRGKRSALLDLRDAAGRARLLALAADAHVFLQGYRPGALDGLGFSAQALAERRPGIVCASLAAWGFGGPWAGRRGFDSLVQTATGLNAIEGRAWAEHQGDGRAPAPRALPVQALDYAAGFLLAFGIETALLRQQQDGGSWQVRVSLAGVGRWLRGLGRVPGGLDGQPPALEGRLETGASGWGELTAVRHAARFSHTPPAFDRPAMPPGTHPPAWW
jgi:crotonobetainyl-CoA:carnitine CoA-transferase CaiB-like acyl-CoA transferase